MLTYVDDAGTVSSGDYYLVQFCLQPDDSFVVVNRLGTEDTADDANIVQMCQEKNGQGDQINFLHLFTLANAISSTCNTITLRLARPPVPTYPTTTSVSTTASPSASVIACVPVPDGQEFRLSLVGTSVYLTGAKGGLTQIGNEGQQLVTTQDYSQAIPFLSAPGREGQITLISGDGTTFYSDQNITGGGNGPVYFDTLDAIENSAFNPVQFCLKSDDTFVVQNLSNDKTDPADDANILQLCPDQEVGQITLYLHTPAVAANSGCNTVRLEIAQAPPATPPTLPANFRIRLASNSQYLTSDPVGPTPGGDANQAFRTTSLVTDASMFQPASGRPNQIMVLSSSGTAIYPNQDMGVGMGEIYAGSAQRIMDQAFNPDLFILQSDDTFVVQNRGNDQVLTADDATIVMICQSNLLVSLYAASNAPTTGCMIETLVLDRIA